MATDRQLEFNMEYERVLQRADVDHFNATQDLATLTAKVPTLTAAWLTAFLADINNARNYPTDTSVKLNLADYTFDIGETMILARKALSVLGKRAQLAFADAEHRQRAFGNDTWDKAYDSQEKMQTALLVAHEVCEKAAYKPTLLIEGMTQADIDELSDLADELRSRNTFQEEAKGERKVSTATRINLFNLVWRRRKRLSLAAQITWPDDAAKHEQYQLYPPAGAAVLTTVVVTVLVGGGAPLDNASVQSSAQLVAQPTNLEGKATFQSTDMPELLTFSVTPQGGGAAVAFPEQYAIIIGDVNEITLTMP